MAGGTSALPSDLAMNLEPHQQLDADGNLLELRRLQPLPRRLVVGARRPGRRARRPRGPRRSARARPGSTAPAARREPGRRRSPSRRLLPGACRSLRGRTGRGPRRGSAVPVVVVRIHSYSAAPTLAPASWATSSSLPTSCSTLSSSILRMPEALTTSFRVSCTSVLVRRIGLIVEEIRVLHHAPSDRPGGRAPRRRRCRA